MPLADSTEARGWSGERVGVPVFSILDHMRPSIRLDDSFRELVRISPFPRDPLARGLLPLEVVSYIRPPATVVSYGRVLTVSRADSSVRVELLRLTVGGNGRSGRLVTGNDNVQHWPIRGLIEKWDCVCHSRVVSW